MPRPLQALYNTWPAIIEHNAVDVEIEHVREQHDTTSAYEHGELLVMKTILDWTDDDWHLINSIPLIATDSNWHKKAKLQALLAPFEKGVPHVLDHCLPGDRAKAMNVRALIAKTMPDLRQAVASLFPNYKIVGENITWRLTPTMREEMHYDYYGDGEDRLHHVRLFVNIDSAPRLWGVSHQIQDMIATYRERLKPWAHLDPNQFNKKASEIIPWAEVPRHYLSFAPGNAWLVNSQVVAHEAVFGNRMIACTFDVDPASMFNPLQSFTSRVRRAWQ